jgi:hypothetical protein
MADRAAIRRMLGRVAVIVLLSSMVASVRACGPSAHAPPSVAHASIAKATCAAASRDSAQTVRTARDTIARLRGHSQRVTSMTLRRASVELRTEDRDPLSAHDGGLVTVDCEGRVTFVWLDGG